MKNAKDFPSIVAMMDVGIQKETTNETESWNSHNFKGTPVDRYPLSPSQIGKCSLALGRNLSHYLNLADYPRSPTALSPRTKRIFARGHLLEAALIDDFEKFTDLKVEDRQKGLVLFKLSDGTPIQGSIDGIVVAPDGTRILVDFKSKGAFYSAGFTDSINQFFAQLRETGYVEEIAENAYLITDAKGLFDIISLDDFFVDYLLQLNAYGSAERVDFVTLYYENKNTSANYEVRWVPSKELFDYAKDKFQFIYNTVIEKGAEAIPKEFALGSSRCKLCEHNEMCWGKYTPPTDAARGKVVGELGAKLDRTLKEARQSKIMRDKVEEEVLLFMGKEDITHVQTSDGLTYERKFLKSPKPHYELRLTK